MIIRFISKQLFFYLINFFHRWYIKRSFWFWARVMDILQAFDRRVAVVINLKMLFTPLYGDYSVMGRILGPLFRFWRVLLGGAFYFLVIVGAGFLWVGYLVLIPFIILEIFFAL